jgi:sulfate transport system ATP-binding protein
LLRIVAGLDHQDSGRILFDGEDMSLIHARDRRVGFVFQHYALFKHMTVFDNIAFGLNVLPRPERPTRAAINQKVCELLDLVQLPGLAHRYPSQLSGGQRQRVALARALAVDPKVLLLDEPFGALDAAVRKELRRWLRKLHDELNVTSLFVTHDQDEAMEVADTVVVMNAGRIEQVGSPEQLYEAPATPFVYEFLGDVNLLSPTQSRTGEDATTQAFPSSSVYARPHELDLARSASWLDGIETRLLSKRRIGSVMRLSLERADGSGMIEAELTHERFLSEQWRDGDRVWVRPSKSRRFGEALH